MVAPGVVLTARHVIEPEQDHLIAGKQEIICTGITPNGLTIWTCHQITLLGNADLAFLIVRSASRLPSILHFATLTTRLPRIGEKVVIAGIRHKTTDVVPIGEPIQLAMMTSVGEITARYEGGRDRVLLPSPCFEIDCAAIGGMSGGPAFDENGFLIGSVTSSIKGERDGPTYLSLLWPAFVETINPIWPEGLHKKPTSLLEMDRRLCAIHRPEAIQISCDEATGHKVATLHHWSE